MTGRVRRLLRKPLVVCGLVAVSILVVTAIFAPYIAPESARTTDFNALFAHPSDHHLLGTDELGHDVFSRLVWGARASLQVALFSTALALFVAVPLGLVAGYYRGVVDTVVARATDVLLAFPFLSSPSASRRSSGRRSRRRRSRSARPPFPGSFGLRAARPSRSARRISSLPPKRSARATPASSFATSYRTCPGR